MEKGFWTLCTFCLFCVFFSSVFRVASYPRLSDLDSGDDFLRRDGRPPRTDTRQDKETKCKYENRRNCSGILNYTKTTEYQRRIAIL